MSRPSPIWTVTEVAGYIDAGVDRTRAALVAEGAAISFRDTVELHSDPVQTVLAELMSDAQVAQLSQWEMG